MSEEVLTITLQCAPMQSCAFTCVFYAMFTLHARNLAWTVLFILPDYAHALDGFIFGGLGGSLFLKRLLVFFFATCGVICPSKVFGCLKYVLISVCYIDYRI